MNRELFRMRGGYSCCAGAADSGWFAGVLAITDVDEAFVPRSSTGYDGARQNCLRWQKTLAQVKRRVVLAGQGLEAPIELAGADNVCGPVAPKERTIGPVIVWTQRRGPLWELAAHSEGQVSSLLQGRSVIRNPGVCASGEGIVSCCERDSAGGQGEVCVYSTEGEELFRGKGRSPKLAASPRGLFLMTERCSRDAITLLLQRIDGQEKRVEIAGGDDYTFNADLVCGPDDIFVVAETCPAFGMDERLGMHRDLKAWRWDKDGELEDISGRDGRLPIKREAFNYWSNENMPPIRPTIFLDGGQPVVAFRRFRHFAFKTFGWDVYICRWGAGGWAGPVRVTESLTTPDTGYGIVPAGRGYVGAFPCVDNPGNHERCSNFRVEIREFDRGFALPPVVVPEERADAYFLTTGYRNIAPEPPEIEEPYEGRTLIWGDLHSHTNYSKCMSAMDGCPDEVFRYASDVLGCRVFTFMDHNGMLGGPEATWLGDRLEALAGDHGIPLYGYETGARPGRHTNWYARDRDLYDKLRCLLGSHGIERLNSYRHAVEELPPGSLVALRHFHGKMAGDEELVQSFEPQLEVAMESMQGRNNALLVTEGRFRLFPNQFLDAGLKVGLVGGSDHFRAKGPNHFCMTGFWVKEASVEGVWEALRNRYTIAMSDARISLAARLKGQPAGRAVSVEEGEGVRVRLSVSCGHVVTRATLIRDGTVLPCVNIDANSATVDLVDPDPPIGRHWYVPTVEVKTAYDEGNRGYGHASPFFVMVRGAGSE